MSNNSQVACLFVPLNLTMFQLAQSVAIQHVVTVNFKVFYPLFSLITGKINYHY